MNETEQYINACLDALTFGITQPVSLLANKKFSSEQRETVKDNLQKFLMDIQSGK